MIKTAEEMAKEQRAISVAEFFEKNRHLLGFDNPMKALLIVVKEMVDNSLEALAKDAGFSESDLIKNVRRIGIFLLLFLILIFLDAEI